MFLTHHSSYRFRAEKEAQRPTVHIPTVYEKVDVEPIRWGYHVLSIDPREAALPDVETLNELGRDGWLLTGMLDERATGKGSQIHFYFVRQLND